MPDLAFENPKDETTTAEPDEGENVDVEGTQRRSQDSLFEGDFSPLPQDQGFRGPVACNAAGITYRQLDYWARTGLVVPEVRDATGSVTQRLYSFRDLLLLKVIKRLIDAGISLQQIRIAVEHLRARGVEDLTEVTLLSDGVSVYECTSDDEVVDLLKGGQGMFGIALGGVWRSIEGTLLDLPTERADDTTRAIDELAARRAARFAG
jgi:DNA-binding transcriptional MerR regulator